MTACFNTFVMLFFSLRGAVEHFSSKGRKKDGWWKQMSLYSPCWFRVARDLQSGGNGQRHFPLCWEPGKWTETGQWAEAEEAEAQQVKGDLPRHSTGWWLPMEVSWGCRGSLGLQSVCLSQPQWGTGQVSPGHWGQDRVSDVWAESTGEPGFQHRDWQPSGLKGILGLWL